MKHLKKYPTFYSYNQAKEFISNLPIPSDQVEEVEETTWHPYIKYRLKFKWADCDFIRIIYTVVGDSLMYKVMKGWYGQPTLCVEALGMTGPRWKSPKF